VEEEEAGRDWWRSSSSFILPLLSDTTIVEGGWCGGKGESYPHPHAGTPVGPNTEARLPPKLNFLTLTPDLEETLAQLSPPRRRKAREGGRVVLLWFFYLMREQIASICSIQVLVGGT
jgi:hypothetical protein